MKLDKLVLERPLWGDDKGILKGEITLAGSASKTTMRIDELTAAKIVNLVADAVQQEAARLANIMTGELLEAKQQALLGVVEPDAAQPTVDGGDDNDIPF